jgi:hypothetical protein
VTEIAECETVCRSTVGSRGWAEKGARLKPTDRRHVRRRIELQEGGG